jgi:hypothetical protein
MKDRFKNWSVGFRSSQLYLALKAHRRLVLLVSITMVVQTGLTLVQPWPIRMMIDHVYFISGKTSLPRRVSRPEGI